MPAQHPAVRTDKRARRSGGTLALQKGLKPVGADKADVLAVGLRRIAQARVGGKGTQVRLGPFTDREEDVLQLFLGKAIEEVALVTVRVQAAQQLAQSAHRVGRGPGVVPGCNVVEAHGARPAEQALELDSLVAEDAGVGRPAGAAGIEKRLHDPPVEGLAEIEHVVGNTKVRRHLARIGDIIDRAAGAACRAIGSQGAAVVRRRTVALRPQPKRDTGHIVALAQQQDGSGTAVNTAAHAQQDPSRHQCPPPGQLSRSAPLPMRPRPWHPPPGQPLPGKPYPISRPTR